MEGLVPFYHKTSPEIAKALESGEKIRPQGLSIFIDPKEAAKYDFTTSAGHIPSDARTVTGTVSSRRIIPDIEWHPDSYKPVFKDIAQQIQKNPEFRVPSLTRTAITPSGTKQFVTPGIISEIDPNTGKLIISRNWEPRFALQYPEGHAHAGFVGEPHALENFPIKDPVSGELIGVDDPRVRPMIQSKSRVTPYGKVGPETSEWGGSATTHGRYPEQRDLDVLTRKSDITNITNDAIEQGKRGFRTQGGSGVSIATGETALEKSASSLAKLARVGKIGAKVLPFVGIPLALYAMDQRASAGDYSGAAIEGASELASHIPLIGTAAALGMQGYLADRDMTDEEREQLEKDKNAERLARTQQELATGARRNIPQK